MFELQQHRYFRPNRRGRDFFVGDIHGELVLLETELRNVRFEPASDRLFALGDLIDRGPDSESVLGLLDEPWFFSVCGNHELMLLAGMENPSAAVDHEHNGGRWFIELPPRRREALAALIRHHCALSFTVATPAGDIGVVHATAPSDWLTLQELSLEDALWEELVWDRQDYRHARMQPDLITPIQHVAATLHGHVSCERVIHVRNRWWIDTLRQSGHLTLLMAGQLLTAGDSGNSQSW